MPKTRKPPAYRLHKQSGQAIVTLPDANGRRKDFMLGPHGSPESKIAYHRVCAEWEARGRTIATDAGVADPSINEIIVAYWDHVAVYYRHRDGTPTSEQANIKGALRPLRELFGTTAAKAFDSIALDAVRNQMIAMGRCRTRINKDVARLKGMFKWAAAKKRIPASVYHDLLTLKHLQAGRSLARETDPVKPVPLAFVEKTMGHAPPIIADMIELQLLAGMRPGELLKMRTCDLDTAGPVWIYTPSSHKTQHHGHTRRIAIGPKGQAIVKRYIKLDTQAYLFSPIEAREQRYKAMREKRKTKVQPSQANRKKTKPKRQPRDHYTVTLYDQAIARAAEKANVPHWHPHQLRHTRATELRRQYGIDAARVVLGHHSAAMAELYAEADQGQAVDIMAKIG